MLFKRLIVKQLPRRLFKSIALLNEPKLKGLYRKREASKSLIMNFNGRTSARFRRLDDLRELVIGAVKANERKSQK